MCLGGGMASRRWLVHFRGDQARNQVFAGFVRLCSVERVDSCSISPGRWCSSLETVEIVHFLLFDGLFNINYT